MPCVPGAFLPLGLSAGEKGQGWGEGSLHDLVGCHGQRMEQELGGMGSGLTGNGEMAVS